MQARFSARPCGESRGFARAAGRPLVQWINSTRGVSRDAKAAAAQHFD